ncbi:MAG TPA: hypothetical protein VFL41_00355 [Gaiellaceae bacterium]|nr:hypothetical protein [Gaiellaceae bacterium]
MSSLALILLPLADAATEGKKVITWMLVVGLVFASIPFLGELYKYLRFHRRGIPPH